MTRIVVTGGDGVIGTALRAVLPAADTVYLTRFNCDIRGYAGVRAALAHHAPEVVIHAAALTDHQHPDPGEIICTNIFGTENVAKAAKGVGAAFVYLSTHYVYPGTKPYYREGARVGPIGTYAWSKLAGEAWVGTLFRMQRHVIVRGSWYTAATRLDRWAARGALTDAWMSREPAAQAARKIAALALALPQTEKASAGFGVVNIGGPRRTFAEVLRDEGYTGFAGVTRAEFEERARLPYVFPVDVSVGTEKFDELKLTW